MLGIVLSGCAAGPFGTNSISSDPVDITGSPSPNSSPSPGASPSPSAAPGAPTLFQFALTVKGTIDPSFGGEYAIMMNSQDTAIDVTNNETFDNFMAWDGTHFVWYTRQTNADEEFDFLPVATIDQNFSTSDDGHTMYATFSLVSDPTNPFATMLENQFTANAATANKGTYLGPIIDTLGPSIDENIEFTVFCAKQVGLVTPAPSGYPNNGGDDLTNVPSGAPPDDYQITSFSVAIH